MKIIATVTNDLSTDQRMIRICTSLAGTGHEVLLVGRELPGSRPLVERPFGQKRMRLLFQKGKFFYLEYNLRLFFFLLFQKFDAVHAVDLDSLLPGFLVCHLPHTGKRRKKCVYDAHEYFTEVPEVVERPAVQKVWEWVASFCIPKLDSAMTVCESLAEVFEKKYGTKFSVVRNVPFRKALPTMRNFPKEKKFILLYQGVLNDGRGLEETITALAFLPNARLWLAGEGDLSGLLRKMVEEKGLEERVKFLGRLSPEQLSELTPQTDIGLNLLKNKGLNYYFSLANKAFDYVQAGLPSLSMDFPEYQKLNAQYGVFHLLPDLQAETIVAAVQHLMEDEKVYLNMVENCRKAAEVLVWENEEKVLLGFYDEVAKKVAVPFFFQ